MANVVKKGFNTGMMLQPGWEITDAEDDTLRSTLVYKGDFANQLRAPRRNDPFPFGNPLYCFQRTLKKLKNNECEVRCEFIGIPSDPTPARVEFPGGSGTAPIETHERFKFVAGTPQNPLNGAVFDPETGEFLGFTTGDKVGVRDYYVPNVMVNLTYWSWRVPQARRIARQVRGGIPGVISPSSVKNFLLIGMPYRQVGKLYQITESYLGSGPNGWDRDFYR